MMNLRGPLIKLTVDGAEFVWGEEQKNAFIRLREIMTSEFVMTYCPLKIIMVTADASSYGMGGVIMHEFPSRFLSRQLHLL